MKEVYIHVGYPKCASSFLQENVFPYLKNVNFIYKYQRDEYNDKHGHHVLINKLIDGKNLISCEFLTGSFSKKDKLCNGFVISDRLKRLYPNAKIILIRREKNRWLKSLYQQFMIDACKSIHIKNYQDWYDNHLNHDLLRFDEYEKKIKNTFKEVLILDFEDLVLDNNTFIQKICDFMDVPFPDNYDKSVKKPHLKSKHFFLIRIFGKLGLCEFNRRYFLGFLRMINKR